MPRVGMAVACTGMAECWLVPFDNAKTASDFIAQRFEYHFLDQRFALVLLESRVFIDLLGIH